MPLGWSTCIQFILYLGKTRFILENIFRRLVEQVLDLNRALFFDSSSQYPLVIGIKRIKLGHNQLFIVFRMYYWCTPSFLQIKVGVECFPPKHRSQTMLPSRFLANSICFGFSLPCCIAFRSCSWSKISNSSRHSHLEHLHLILSNINTKILRITAFSLYTFGNEIQLFRDLVIIPICS